VIRRKAPSSAAPARSVEVQIESVAYGGAGVGRVDGKVYFVPFTVPGERVQARAVRDQKRFCEAKLVSVEVDSALRQAAPCPAFSVCGGCAYQHVDYEVQLIWKRDQVADLLRRIARIPEPPVRDTVPSPKHWAYRNRIRVHARNGRIGFFKKHSSDLVDVAHCPIASEAVNAELKKLRSSNPEPGEYTLSVRPGVRFFEQTNDGAAAELVRVVEELVGCEKGLLVDAYCGAGFFARRLVSRFQRIIGIETHEGAVESARRRAGETESYICADVATTLGEVLGAADRTRTVVLLDPPAAGMAVRVVELLVTLPVRELVYISCDPATQARDIGALVKGGYRLKSVTPVDMFPQTADVEVVACLELAS
jgi:23S rRNA (uracil1939-C5)-methyltransferase